MEKTTIGEFLATLRKEGGYTQQDVADKLNISDRTLSSWETGRTEPDLSSLTALADFYGLTVDEILRGEKIAAPEFKKDAAEQAPNLSERFQKLLSGLKMLTALGALCAAVVLAGFILFLYFPAPMWVGIALVFAGVAGNAACIAFIYQRMNKALLSLSDEEKSVVLYLKHKAAMCVILNSLAYIAWVIVILMCYWFVSYYDTNPTGTVHEYYDLYTVSAVVICGVSGIAQLLFAVSTNLANVNCLGNERQKAAAKTNVKTFKIISAFGAVIFALCLIPYAVFCNVNFTDTNVYFTAEGVDELYKTFQTYNLGETAFTDLNSDGEWQTTVIPEGEYYLDFQSETYVEASVIYYEIFPHTTRFYSLGNNFYARCGSGDISDLKSVGIYYLIDGVNIEDISLDKDYNVYFHHLKGCPIVRFTSPEGERLAAACVPYYFKRDEGYYDDEGWLYNFGDYNIRDELVLKRDGNEYSYCLITYRNYTPLATVALVGSFCVTACVCVAAHLIKRKKIHYGF